MYAACWPLAAAYICCTPWSVCQDDRTVVPICRQDAFLITFTALADQTAQQLPAQWPAARQQPSWRCSPWHLWQPQQRRQTRPAGPCWRSNPSRRPSPSQRPSPSRRPRSTSRTCPSSRPSRPPNRRRSSSRRSPARRAQSSASTAWAAPCAQPRPASPAATPTRSRAPSAVSVPGCAPCMMPAAAAAAAPDASFCYCWALGGHSQRTASIVPCCLQPRC
jgi:hypothetical protein